MNARPLLALALLLASANPSHVAAQRAYSIADVQGTWWSDCNTPPADFTITGNAYTGDFEGSFLASVIDNELVVDFSPDSGIVHWPIVQADGESLVLRLGTQEVRYTHCSTP